uniref:Uncharacterized protein n=1 Tax=Anguilla anguilla TaxID=7936 RepID=A0A0E9TAW2_ANGAN
MHGSHFAPKRSPAEVRRERAVFSQLNLWMIRWQVERARLGI